jgi:predicted nucleic acid-binding protein
VTPDARAAQPLFVDTGAFYAWFKPDDDDHARATAVFDGIQSGELPYRPVLTSRYVLSELATLTLYHVGHREAVKAFDTIRESETFSVLPADEAVFTAAREQFGQYDDQEISFVDHLSGVLAREYDVERVFAFDSDFRTLGFTVVPEDTGEPSDGCLTEH